MSDQPIISLQSVEKRFHMFKAVSRFDLEIRPGEFFSLLGPSGCGKTTVLRMIAGLQEPTSGRIVIDGRDMSGIPANRRPTNMVFQSYAIFPHLNVADNVGFGLVNAGLSRTERALRIGEALDMVELGGFQDRRPDALSGGQRQRVALARALVMKPKVLLLDEPLSALDKNMRETMQLELRRLQKSVGITFVMVTHDQYEAMTMSDRIGVMFNGELAQVETPGKMYSSPANRSVAAFIGGMNFMPASLVRNGGDRLDVDMAGFGRMSIRRNPHISGHADRLLVGLRPEQVTIGTGKPSAKHPTAKGVVREVAFYGESIRYHVEVDGLDELLAVAVPNHFHAADFDISQVVWITVQGASVIDLGSAAQGTENPNQQGGA